MSDGSLRGIWVVFAWWVVPVGFVVMLNVFDWLDKKLEAKGCAQDSGSE